MISHPVQTTSLKKGSFDTKKEQPVQNYVESHFPKILRSELNLWGKMIIFGTYTMICLVIGKQYFGTQKIEVKEDQALTINRLIENVDDLKAQGELAPLRIVESNKLLLERLEERFFLRIQSQRGNDQEIIKQKEEELRDLREKLSALISLKENSREVASNTEKTIPYNVKNRDIFSYQHKMKLGRLRDQQKREHDAYVSIHNLDNPAEMGQYKDFIDNQKLKYYQMEREFEQERQDFYQNKYRIVKN
jgi:hypothetical protein